jgi:hypothetical protein
MKSIFPWISLGLFSTCWWFLLLWIPEAQNLGDYWYKSWIFKCSSSVKHEDLPKKLQEFVGKEYLTEKDIEEAMNAKLKSTLNENHDEL